MLQTGFLLLCIIMKTHMFLWKICHIMTEISLLWTCLSALWGCKWTLTYFVYSKWESTGYTVWEELIWDQPGPNKQIKWKQITSVWLDVWRDQFISGQEEMENSQSLVNMKRIQWHFSVKRATEMWSSLWKAFSVIKISDSITG